MGKSSVILLIVALVNGIVSAPTDASKAKDFIEFARIIDGTPINVSDYPFYAYIVVDESPSSKSVCGGVILSERWILTAAHCVVIGGHWFPYGRVYVGGDSVENSQLYFFDHSIPHETYGYEYGRSAGDIALLHISQPLKFSEKVKPVKLPSQAYEEGPVYLVGRGMNEMEIKNDNEAYNKHYNSESVKSSFYDSDTESMDSNESKSTKEKSTEEKINQHSCGSDHYSDCSDVDSSLESKELNAMLNKRKFDDYNIFNFKVTKVVELYALPMPKKSYDACSEGRTVFCTIRKQLMPSSCAGDSGSPIVRGNTLIGIVSSISNPFNIRMPQACEFSPNTTNVNVAYYVPWIVDTMYFYDYLLQYSK